MIFQLDPSEQKKAAEWINSKDRSKDVGAIGGRFTFTFTPTSLGMVTKVIDDLDKSEIDVTDYESW